MKKRIVLIIICIMMVMIAGCKKEGASQTKKVTLTMGSWRVDDVKQIGKIIAAFNTVHPEITIQFDPTNPPEYNAVLKTQLQGGTAPDLIYLRSFSVSQQLYNEGYIESITDLPGLKENFTPEACMPWALEDGTIYGVPFMAVSHGIYYNSDIFKEVGVEVPDTWEELLVVCEKLKNAGHTPFANASKDEWTIAEMVFMNLAPNFIGGYEGREEYASGKRCFNDDNVVGAFQAIADIAPYYPKDHIALSYYDSQQLFLTGKAAMFMAGSWDIAMFESTQPGFEWSIFATPALEGKPEYVCFHMDAGIGLNKASKNKEAAKKFLSWLTTKELATLLGNEIPGFFPISKHDVTLSNSHANTFLALNKGRGLDVRWAWPRLLAGSPNGYELMQSGAIGVLKNQMTPKEAADALQEGLAKWFEPAKNCK